MSGHDHDHALAVTTHRGRILLVLVLTSTVLVVEVIGAIITGSLALLTALYASDRAWMLYNGLLAYVMMGVLFAGEWLVRRRVKAAHAHG